MCVFPTECKQNNKENPNIIVKQNFTFEKAAKMLICQILFIKVGTILEV